VFVLDGVLERFPQLKIASAENDVAWVPYFMWRMDFARDRFGTAHSLGFYRHHGFPPTGSPAIAGHEPCGVVAQGRCQIG
jgi:hypothetical protein